VTLPFKLDVQLPVTVSYKGNISVAWWHMLWATGMMHLYLLYPILNMSLTMEPWGRKEKANLKTLEKLQFNLVFTIHFNG